MYWYIVIGLIVLAMVYWAVGEVLEILAAAVTAMLASPFFWLFFIAVMIGPGAVMCLKLVRR